jgi:hypothetical protein
LGLKITTTISLFAPQNQAVFDLASKPVVMVSSGLASKPVVGFLVEPQN